MPILAIFEASSMTQRWERLEQANWHLLIAMATIEGCVLKMFHHTETSCSRMEILQKEQWEMTWRIPSTALMVIKLQTTSSGCETMMSSLLTSILVSIQLNWQWSLTSNQSSEVEVQDLNKEVLTVMKQAKAFSLSCAVRSILRISPALTKAPTKKAYLR